MVTDMKSMKFTAKAKFPKTRVHKILFDNDSPFKGKRHDDKHAYRRKPKFNKWDNWED